MAKNDERLARIEESNIWIKKELVHIRGKVDGFSSPKLSTRLIVALFTIVALWLSALSTFAFALARAIPR